MLRILLISIAMMMAVSGAFTATPASAQFFLQNPDMRGPAVRGDEPGVQIPLPDATPAEIRAGLVWNMRAALNVAALGCDFAPTVLAPNNYNALLVDHGDELKSSFNTLSNYFTRRIKNKKEAQSAFDTYQTRVYSSFSTVYAKLIFCQTAGIVGGDALFIKRGTLGDLAQERITELRNSLVVQGEQRFGGRISMQVRMALPDLDPKCWKGTSFNFRKCRLGG